MLVTRLQPEQWNLVREAIRQNLPAAADALRASLGVEEFRLEPGEDVPVGERLDDFTGPGLVAWFDVDGDRFAVLVPEVIAGANPSPDTDDAAEPDEETASALNSLAVEWSLCFLPPEFEAHRAESEYVADLRGFVSNGDLAEWARAVPLTVIRGDETDAADAAPPVLLFIGPLANPEVPETYEDAPNLDVSPPQPENKSTPVASHVRKPPAADNSRLLPLAVSVSVRLAEKSIDVDQFVRITPGSLITFDKNCEDPLELFVGNQLYARGEAVKIGEKFGLKIDEIGVTRERVSNIFLG